MKSQRVSRDITLLFL